MSDNVIKPNTISELGVSECLRHKEIRVLSFETLDSTSTEARRRAESDVEAPILIIANEQTSGRGRMGREFFSPRDTGLYMSLLLDASESAYDNIRLTTAAAVAVCMSISDICGIDSMIKWVNDLYLGGKKICGILAESFCSSTGKRYVSIGIGLNLSTESFPEAISDIAASLFPKKGNREELAAEISDRLYGFYENTDDPRIMEYYREHSMVLGERIIFRDGDTETEALAEDISEFGGLCVRLDDGSRRILSSGEISLRVKGKGER